MTEGSPLYAREISFSLFANQLLNDADPVMVTSLSLIVRGLPSWFLMIRLRYKRQYWIGVPFNSTFCR